MVCYSKTTTENDESKLLNSLNLYSIFNVPYGCLKKKKRV